MSADAAPRADRIHPDLARFGPWFWRKPMRGEHFRRCSHCGCVHPEDLAAEPVWRAEWADMKYGWPHKFYVDIPNRDPNALFVVSTSTHRSAAEQGRYFARDELDRAQRAVVRREGYRQRGGYRPAYFQFGTRAHHFGKFYTVHLADPALSPGVKDLVEHHAGLRFTFYDDGRVGWESAAAPPAASPADA